MMMLGLMLKLELNRGMMCASLYFCFPFVIRDKKGEWLKLYYGKCFFCWKFGDVQSISNLFCMVSRFEEFLPLSYIQFWGCKSFFCQ
jgi:hypothetical protein